MKRLNARVAETAVIARCRLNGHDLLHIRPGNGRYNHLGDTVSAFNCERLLRKVDEDHTDYAPIVAVNRPRGVQDADAVAERETAPGPDLGLEPRGDHHANARGDKAEFARIQYGFSFNGSAQVQTRCALGVIFRKGDVPAIGFSIDVYLSHKQNLLRGIERDRAIRYHQMSVACQPLFNLSHVNLSGKTEAHVSF